MQQKYFSTRKPYSKRKKTHPFYRFARKTMSIFYPRHQVNYKTAPDSVEVAMFIGNHARAYGPLTMVMCFDRSFRPWVINDILYFKSFPKFARWDFFPARTKLGKVGSWLLSYLGAPLSVAVMTGAEAIPVYYDSRVRSTFTKTLQTLKEGKNVVVFADNRVPFSKYNQNFSSGFVHTARLYYKETGIKLKFYPFYICQARHTINIGTPIIFDPEKPFLTYREEVACALRDAVTALGIEQEAIYLQEHPQASEMPTYLEPASKDS